jgi:hypothetical protein
MGEELYLVEDPERENKAVELFLEHGLRENFQRSMGIWNQNWWVVRNFQKRRLGENGGDIDLLFGLCVFRDGAWEPSYEFLAGVEAKCFYRTFEEDTFRTGRNFKSVKDSHQKFKTIQGQIRWMVDAGLDSMVFLDLIANPPSDSFLGAAGLAGDSFDKAINEVVRNFDLPDLGHYRMSIGSVAGGTERMRGSISSPFCLKNGSRNRIRNPEMRERFRMGLQGVFPRLDRAQDVFTGIFPRAYFDSGEKTLIDETYRRLGLPLHRYSFQ